MKKHVFEAFSYLQKRHVFEAFSSLKNEKACFWSVFKFTKWKNTFLKRFESLQNENKRKHWNVFRKLKKQHALEVFFMFKK